MYEAVGPCLRGRPTLGSCKAMNVIPNARAAATGDGVLSGSRPAQRSVNGTAGPAPCSRRQVRPLGGGSRTLLLDHGSDGQAQRLGVDMEGMARVMAVEAAANAHVAQLVEQFSRSLSCRLRDDVVHP